MPINVKNDYAMLRQLWVLVALAVAFPIAVSAQTSPTDGGWQFHATPYLWLSGLQGKVTTGGGRTIPVDASFGDILDATDSLIGLAGYFDARKGKWGIFTDVMFIKMGVDGIVQDDGLIDLTNSLTLVEVGGLYRLVDSGGASGRESSLDFVYGVRSTAIELSTDLKPIEGVSEGRELIKNKQNWVDPFLGFRGEAALARRISLVGSGDMGGFGVGSDFTWKAFGAVNIHVAEWFGILAGYRALGQDYQNNDDEFRWDMVMHGPIVGFGFTF